MRLPRRGATTRLDEAVRVAQRLIPDPWSIEGFVESVSAHRGRLIEIGEDDLSAWGASGLWLDFGTHDVILHRRGASPAQREAIICHELGHMLCGHESLGCLGSSAESNPLDTTLATRMLGRTQYDDAREAEAERFSARMLTMTRAGSDDATRGHLAGRLR